MATNTITTQEAARRLQVSRQTIINMIERGSINAYKLDPKAKSVYRIPESEIERVLAERTRKEHQPG